MERQAERVEGFPIKPVKDFVYVVEYGQPDRTEEGVLFGSVTMLGAPEDTQFGRYRSSEWRYGQVVAIGVGKPRWSKKLKRDVVPEAPFKVGDTVMYSRRFGSRLGAENRFQAPGHSKPLNVRVFSVDQIVAVVDDFEPWWPIEECQLDPNATMTG
jgi:co-chaperonin GroES (HSP10)